MRIGAATAERQRPATLDEYLESSHKWRMNVSRFLKRYCHERFWKGAGNAHEILQDLQGILDQHVVLVGMASDVRSTKFERRPMDVSSDVFVIC